MTGWVTVYQWFSSSIIKSPQVSTLQHPDEGNAPASIVPNAASSSSQPNLESMLGIVPHSIRGSLRNFEQFLPTTALFKNCTACSKEVGGLAVSKTWDLGRYYSAAHLVMDIILLTPN